MAFSSPEMQRRPIQTKVYYKIFYSIRKENTQKPWKEEAAKKKISPVCILLVQLALMSVFYSMWWLEDITFYKILLLIFCFFSSAILLLSLK